MLLPSAALEGSPATQLVESHVRSAEKPCSARETRLTCESSNLQYACHKGYWINLCIGGGYGAREPSHEFNALVVAAARCAT